MQSAARTPAEYLESLEDDWRRETLEALREMLTAEAPDAVEDIGYGMLSYTLGDRALFHLHTQKNYVSLYVGDTRKIDPEGTMLAGLDLGKGCIRFKKSVQVEQTGIQTFIAEAARMARAGLDTYC